MLKDSSNVGESFFFVIVFMAFVDTSMYCFSLNVRVYFYLHVGFSGIHF